MLNIVYSNDAQIDLYEAIEFISKESKLNAQEYLAKYEKKISLLQENPEMGTDCKNKLIKRICRVLVFESHLIVYQVKKEQKEILIIRIFHGSVNYQEKI